MKREACSICGTDINDLSKLKALRIKDEKIEFTCGACVDSSKCKLEGYSKFITEQGDEEIYVCLF